MSIQSINVLSACLGALLGLASLSLNLVRAASPHSLVWTFQHQTAISLISAVGLILVLRHPPANTAGTMLLCGVLGLSCAMLTVSLIR